MSTLPLTRDKLRDCSSIFNYEVKSNITVFRHKSEQEQNDFLNDILTKTILLVQNLKHIQIQDKLDKSYVFRGKKK